MINCLPFPKKLTLFELLTTLVVVASLTVVALSQIKVETLEFGSSKQTAKSLITEQTLKALSKAVFGEGGIEGYFQDFYGTNYSMPENTAALLRVPETLPPSLQSFQPQIKRGWRGPYITQPKQSFYGKKEAELYQYREGFDGQYGKPEDPAVLDAWGNPIVLQVEMDGVPGISKKEAKYARFVSAGPNGILETPLDPSNQIPGEDPETQLTLDECGDDLVLFLKVTDLRR